MRIFIRGSRSATLMTWLCGRTTISYTARGADATGWPASSWPRTAAATPVITSSSPGENANLISLTLSLRFEPANNRLTDHLRHFDSFSVSDPFNFEPAPDPT